MTGQYDVAIIGAGVVGCAIARELAAGEATVVLLDARCDVGDGTSKANTAIVPTGFDKPPGSLESRLVTRGHDLLHAYAKHAGIAVERPGAVLVAWDDEQVATLPRLHRRAADNGYHQARLVDSDEVYTMLPRLGPGALGGLFVPGEGIIDPWSTTLAYATDAIARGADLRLNCRVDQVRPGPAITSLTTSRGTVRARWVINAAGLGADVIDRQFGHHRFTVTPRRGELIVFDKGARSLAPHIVLPVPSSRGKGILITPTVFGNVMLGPTAEDLEDRTDTSTSSAGLQALLDKGRRIMPALLNEEVTTSYAGLRSATEHNDYVIDFDTGQRYVCVGGIRSTGLVSSLAIAEYVVDGLGRRGFDNPPRPSLPEPCRVPPLGESQTRPYQQKDSIAADPEYGRVVCFCERVTYGEVRDAFASVLPPQDIDGLRRRTRVLMGRCQGFFCGAEIERLLREGTAR